MEPHLIVTLARLRDASELYRQLEDANRALAANDSRERDLKDLSAEYMQDIEAVRSQARNLSRESRRLEDELQQIEAKLLERRSRQAGKAGTIQALVDEMAALQERREKLEQDLLELWQQRDDAASALSAEQHHADAARRRLDQKRAELDARSRRAGHAVPEIMSELAHLLRQLTRPVAGKLQKIAQRHPDPVADLRQGACGSCGQTLPPQEAVDADREAALITCQGCGRFIVARSSRRTRA